tara:strand:+ start:575 stop:985 length:411 start_codon:yes stop_codon:yes gene_type:complete
MNLTLKNVKYFKAGSQETPNFVADLYDDGTHVAGVTNDGWGGPNCVSPVNGGKYESVRKYDNLDVQSDIFGLVYDYDDVTKYQGDSLVMKKGDELHTCKFTISIARLKSNPKYRAFLDAQIKDYEKKGFTIINRNI